MLKKDFALQIANWKVCGLNANDAADKWERECPEPSYCTHTDLNALAKTSDESAKVVRRRVFP